MMKKGTIALIAVAGLATAASGQTAATYQLVATNVVTPASPSTTIEVWATWTGALHLFAGGDYDLNASGGVFSNPVNVLNGPGTTAGTPAGSSVTGALNGQLHIPVLGFFGDPANPILLATYTWTTTDFTNRTVSLNTSNTSGFLVAWINDGPGGVPPAGTTVQLFPQEFTAGSGNIGVTPAPPVLALLGLGGLVATRRRR